MTFRSPPAYFPNPDAMEMRETYGDDVREHLDALIEACEDARRGYESAAGKVSDDVVAAGFRIYAAQRAEFVTELASLGSVFGVDPDDDGSLEGAFRRAWLVVKSALTGQDTGAVIDAVLEIEEETTEAYEAALTAGLPPHVEAPVRRQYAEVQEAVTSLRQMRDRSDV